MEGRWEQWVGAMEGPGQADEARRSMREACISAVGALGMKAVAHLDKPDAAEVVIAVARELTT